MRKKQSLLLWSARTSVPRRAVRPSPTTGRTPVFCHITDARLFRAGDGRRGLATDRRPVWRRAAPPKTSDLPYTRSPTALTASYPAHGGLIQASNGVPYGTAINGGTNNNTERFSRSQPTACSPRCLTFTGSATDGSTPYAGLLQGTNGSFYGAPTQGDRTVVGPFSNGLPAARSASCMALPPSIISRHGHPHQRRRGKSRRPLMEGTNGNFYGTTSTGAAMAMARCLK